MKRLLIALPLALMLSACMTVLGYEPTPAELEAIKRGEAPRADKGEQAEVNKPGDESRKPAKDKPIFEPDQSAGPSEGIVLRWIDSSRVVIEADSKSETVILASGRGDLDTLMDTYTYGTAITLTYSQKDAQGQTIYRDENGNLLADIRKP